jgi:hypothetical protein
MEGYPCLATLKWGRSLLVMFSQDLSRAEPQMVLSFTGCLCGGLVALAS